MTKAAATRASTSTASLLTASSTRTHRSARFPRPSASWESAPSLPADSVDRSAPGAALPKTRTFAATTTLKQSSARGAQSIRGTCAFWERLVRAARSSIVTGKPVQVWAVPRIVTNYDGTDLTITLPSGRVINYPNARLVPSEKFVNGVHDIEFMDNANGQWKPVRAWYGVLVENVVQGIARDLLAAAI